MGFRSLVATLAVVAVTFSLPSPITGTDALDTGQKEAMEKVVREYLLKHPEVIVEAIRTFQAREEQATKERAQANLVARRNELVNDPTSPIAGNPDGDVTIVEFFDLRCGFCKQVLPIVMALMEDDPNVRYVFKEFPILGPESVVASRAALAAWRLDKDKYLAFHLALMGSRGSLPESKVMKLAAKSGYDVEELRRELTDPEIEVALKQNLQLADSLNINGTPTFIIGNRLFPGAITAKALNGAVADTREACQKTGIC